MRAGMTREAFAAAIANLAKDQGSKGTPECIPAAQHTLCMWGAYGAMLSDNQVFEITYKIPLLERPISGFVKVFTQKYGKPIVQRRSYRNGLGATFAGEVFVWHLHTQSLEVAEICSEIDEPCVRLADPRLMKEGPPPPI